MADDHLRHDQLTGRVSVKWQRAKRHRPGGWHTQFIVTMKCSQLCLRTRRSAWPSDRNAHCFAYASQKQAMATPQHASPSTKLDWVDCFLKANADTVHH